MVFINSNVLPKTFFFIFLLNFTLMTYSCNILKRNQNFYRIKRPSRLMQLRFYFKNCQWRSSFRITPHNILLPSSSVLCPIKLIPTTTLSPRKEMPKQVEITIHWVSISSTLKRKEPFLLPTFTIIALKSSSGHNLGSKMLWDERRRKVNDQLHE